MKFGTSGLRGLVVELEGRPSAVYATAFAKYLLETGASLPGGTILVGRDLRPSSPGIASICMGALERAGLTPVDCGEIPTPALALQGAIAKAPCLMITGSHIPADRNGIKFYTPTGEITKTDELNIQSVAVQLFGADIDFSAGTAEDRQDAAVKLFLSRNYSVLPRSALTGLKIGLYEHSTVARDLLRSVLEHFGAHVIPLGRSESFVPVDTEALEAETLANFAKWAIAFDLDAIVSSDGDGDRPLMADEFGRQIRGDVIGVFTSSFLGANVVVTPVTSNSSIESVVSSAVVRTRVGSPFVIAAMEETISDSVGSVIGFEANGGAMVGSTFTVATGVISPLMTRDSFLPILAVLSARAIKQKPLSELVSELGLSSASSDRLEHFPIDLSAKLMLELTADENVRSFFAALGEVVSCERIDGVRVSFPGGMSAHLRPSGNAPEMRCYTEAGSEDASREMLVNLMAHVRKWADSRT